ncbi:MAG: BREX-1 system adenine-specific DNA-methyltransferase PglX [Bradymonadales bacterium]|jgi:hypothetical protein
MLKSCKKSAKKLRSSLYEYLSLQRCHEELLEAASYYWYINLCSWRILDVENAWPQKLAATSLEQLCNEENSDSIARTIKNTLLSLHKLLPHCIEEANAEILELCPAQWLKYEALPLLKDAFSEENTNNIERIAWLFQFYFSRDKREIAKSMRRSEKIDQKSLPTVTQVFTPQWIIQCLLHNALTKLSAIKDLPYVLSPAPQNNELSQQEISICDPACGAALILLQAVESLWPHYQNLNFSQSEILSILAKTLHGFDIDPRATRLASFVLLLKIRNVALKHEYTLDISEEYLPKIHCLKNISFKNEEKIVSALSQKTGLASQKLLALFHEFGHASSLGSLIAPRLSAEEIQKLRTVNAGIFKNREEYTKFCKLMDLVQALAQKHDIVITNPPYLGKRFFSKQLNAWAKINAPMAKDDLFAMFILRCIEMAKDGGFASLVVMQSWMYLSRYAALRAKLRQQTKLISLALLESSLMGIAFGTSAVVWQKTTSSEHKSVFCFVGKADLCKGVPKTWPPKLYLRNVEEFKKLPGEPLAFKLTAPMIEILSKSRRLEDYCELRQGLATTNNERFLRAWHEVGRENIAFCIDNAEEALASKATWFPYNKGGKYRKWWGNQYLVLNWKNDGEEIKENIIRKYPYLKGDPAFVAKNQAFYFKPAISFSKVGLGLPSFRYYPKGFVFDVAGTSIFAKSDEWRQILAFLNSKLACQLLQNLAPTLNIEIKQCGKLPWLLAQPKERINELVDALIHDAKDDWNSTEQSWDFTKHEVFLPELYSELLEDACKNLLKLHEKRTKHVWEAEYEINERILHALNFENYMSAEPSLENIALFSNPNYVYKAKKSLNSYEGAQLYEVVASLISYAVSCAFGRYDAKLSVQGCSELNMQMLHTALLKFLKNQFSPLYFRKNLEFIEAILAKPLLKYLENDFMLDHKRRYGAYPLFCCTNGVLRVKSLSA